MKLDHDWFILPLDSHEGSGRWSFLERTKQKFIFEKHETLEISSQHFDNRIAAGLFGQTKWKCQNNKQRIVRLDSRKCDSTGLTFECLVLVPAGALRCNGVGSMCVGSVWRWQTVKNNLINIYCDVSSMPIIIIIWSDSVDRWKWSMSKSNS